MSSTHRVFKPLRPSHGPVVPPLRTRSDPTDEYTRRKPRRIKKQKAPSQMTDIPSPAIVQDLSSAKDLIFDSDEYARRKTRRIRKKKATSQMTDIPSPAIVSSGPSRPVVDTAAENSSPDTSASPRIEARGASAGEGTSKPCPAIDMQRTTADLDSPSASDHTDPACENPPLRRFKIENRFPVSRESRKKSRSTTNLPDGLSASTPSTPVRSQGEASSEQKSGEDAAQQKTYIHHDLDADNPVETPKRVEPDQSKCVKAQEIAQRIFAERASRQEEAKRIEERRLRQLSDSMDQLSVGASSESLDSTSRRSKRRESKIFIDDLGTMAPKIIGYKASASKMPEATKPHSPATSKMPIQRDNFFDNADRMYAAPKVCSPGPSPAPSPRQRHGHSKSQELRIISSIVPPPTSSLPDLKSYIPNHPHGQPPPPSIGHPNHFSSVIERSTSAHAPSDSYYWPLPSSPPSVAGYQSSSQSSYLSQPSYPPLGNFGLRHVPPPQPPPPQPKKQHGRKNSKLLQIPRRHSQRRHSFRHTPTVPPISLENDFTNPLSQRHTNHYKLDRQGNPCVDDDAFRLRGLFNFSSFLTATTPSSLVPEDHIGKVHFDLPKIWDSFEETSLFGAQVPFIGPLGKTNSCYVPYLSAIQLYDAHQPSSNQPIFQFFERKQPHHRPTLYTTIEELRSSPGGEWLSKSSEDLAPSSWFAILWSPVKHSVFHQEGQASFLVFYRFNIAHCGSTGTLMRIGVVPYRADSTYWVIESSSGEATVTGTKKYFEEMRGMIDKWMSQRAVHHPDFDFVKYKMILDQKR